jgi:hypothetical protein
MQQTVIVLAVDALHRRRARPDAKSAYTKPSTCDSRGTDRPESHRRGGGPALGRSVNQFPLRGHPGWISIGPITAASY